MSDRVAYAEAMPRARYLRDLLAPACERIEIAGSLVYDGIPVDLFIVRPPADWGVIFTIRTGPAEWSEKLVTECQRFFRRVENGQLLHVGRPVSCPEERDFFEAIGQPWVEPRERRADQVRLSPPRPAA